MLRMYDIIAKKRDKKPLSEAEIKFFVNGTTASEIPDYQISAMLMAIYINGMTDQETSWLTKYMTMSGDMVDLSTIDGIKIDKHSTGGVGDKTTLIVAPIVAACGVKVAKMSGRGLGHTGGTIDKLEAIPNFKVELNRSEFFEIVNNIGLSVIGQSGNIAPADKKLYALRDVTATVESIPLIAASIMSKKLAAGSDCILLDVKTGSGAFMKTLDGSIELAKTMVAIGGNSGKRTAALITNMDIPLGKAIGNSLEVIEAVEILNGKGSSDLKEICIQLATQMLCLASKGSQHECEKLANNAITSGEAFRKFRDMVLAQGGDISVIDDTDKFNKADFCVEVRASKTGYIIGMNTEQCGICSVVLGAGRENKNSAIDYSAGIMMCKKYGDSVSKNDVIARLYSNNDSCLKTAEDIYLNAIIIGDVAPLDEKLVYAKVNVEGTEILG